MNKKEAIMIIADQDNGCPSDIVQATSYLMNLRDDNEQIGMWIDFGKNEDGTYNMVCSNCRQGFKCEGHCNSEYTKARWKFCPTCGIKMKWR